MTIADIIDRERDSLSVYTQARHRLAEAAPTVGSWKQEPMTPDEIDAHPDADRIWATVMMLRGDR